MKIRINEILKKKHLVGLCAILFAALFTVAITGMLSSCNFQDEDVPVIADNVFIFNPEAVEDEIISCDDNSLEIKTIYGLTHGSVLTSGISSKCPYGLLRKVESIEQLDNGYKVSTSQATLTDAIRECNVHYYADFHPDGTYEVVNKNGKSEKDSIFADLLIQKAYADPLVLGEEFPFGNEIFNGKFGYRLNFDCNIHDFKVYLKITGEVYLDAGLNKFNKVSTGDVELFSKNLPPVVLDAGIPIVVNSDVAISANCTAKLMSFELDAGASISKEVGFEYYSDWGFKGICEDHSIPPHFNIKAQKNLFSGNLNSSLTGTFSAKLYNVAGFGVNIGLNDEMSLRLKKLEDWENNVGCIHLPGLNWDLKGTYDNKIYVPISGDLIFKVGINIFDKNSPLDIFNITIIDEKFRLFDTDQTITLLEEHLSFGNLDDDPDFNAANQIALVLDVSGSMSGQPLEALKSACIRFLNSATNSKVLISIIGFETTARVYVEDSSDISAMLNIVNNLKDLGSTNMEDGLAKAYQILSRSNNTKKSIVLMSDGLPNQGKTDSALISYAGTIKNSGVTIYTLGFFHNISGNKSTAQNLLRDIATTGCRYEADSSSSLQEFFDQISSQIKGTSYYYVEIKCPVNVSVSYNGETLSSSTNGVAQRRSFGSLCYADEENSTDRTKILRLVEGPSYDLNITGYGAGKMNYSIGYVNENGIYDDTRYFDDISVNQNTKINTKAKLTDTNEMLVDNVGDGLNITKYKASSNEHAKIVSDNASNSNLSDNNFYEEIHEEGFLEKFFKDINRFFSDIYSYIWYMLTQ